jgi:hypothetical protein
MIIQRKVVRRNGDAKIHSYHQIGGVDVNLYYRNKMRERYKRKREPMTLIENFADHVTELHQAGHSQRAICKALNSNRYQVQKALGSR